MKNFIIGFGETLTENVVIKQGGGDKSHPYSYEEARQALVNDLEQVISEVAEKPDNQCVNGEVVIEFIQHPSYLAKTYYPSELFKKFGMKDVGSKAVKIKPRKWAIKNPPEIGVSSCVFVSGKKSQFQAMLNAVKYDGENLPEGLKNLIQSLETVTSINTSEKVKKIDPESTKLKLEVVLHASEADSNVRNSFAEYVNFVGGETDWNRAKSVGGLTFLPVIIDNGREVDLAKFSHLRVVRSIPKLRFNRPDVIRASLDEAFSLPEYKNLNNDFKVCIFDGGLGDGTIMGQWVNEHIPPDVNSSHPKLLAHGSEVCSTYLFGPYDQTTKSFQEPYTSVDIVRVLSDDDTDPDLFDVLTRIENVLKTKAYKYVNLSLGPRIPVEDDDVHVWTSVIDALLQDGHCLATVAIGNDGEMEGGYSRIQPPSDMVNCFAVGASNTNDGQCERAPYSCVGPGRSPGMVKPDGIIFGGSSDNLFKLYSPLTHSITGTMGTSYSAPYALRVMAGIDAITNYELTPTTVKALMIHHADPQNNDRSEVGWGLLPNTPEQVIECKDDEAIIVYQGTLKQSQHLRIPIPVPDGINCTWVHLKATFCFNAGTDPEHPLHYTRNGLVITFRPNAKKYSKDAEHPDSDSFFRRNDLYLTEEELRDDAHKWETCLSHKRRFKKTTLSAPMFDVKFHAREKGGQPENNGNHLSYSLVLSIRAQGETQTYNKVLQQNQTLQSVKLRSRTQII